MSHAQQDPSSSNAAPAANAETPVYQSQHLLKGQREIRIIHRGVCYRLQTTSRGRLILQK